MRKHLDSQAETHAAASGRSSSARSVKAQIYGAGKAATAASGSRSGAAAAAAERGYPTVAPQGSASSPINNMGENLRDSHDQGEIEMVLSDGRKPKIVMIKRPAHGQVCIIDWINVTVLEDTWFRTAREHLISNDEIVMEASRHLEKIFGFGVTAKRDTGMNFYKESWVLGDEMGFVCFGGQRQTMLITLTGQGCSNALPGWQLRLHEFLAKTAIRPSISRIDLAHDDLEGAYLSVDWADEQFDLGGFKAKKGGGQPNIEHVGNWKRPTGAGRTLYIGVRSSGKFCRFYEKGKKEGDVNSPWCRVEVEFKSCDRIIPLDILVDPSQYFSGAYPCFGEFAHYPTISRMELKQKTAEVVMDKMIATMRHQFGKHNRVVRELYGDKDALDRICNPDKNAWPKRLKPLTSTAHTGPEPMHRAFEVPQVPAFIDFIKAVPSFGLNGKNCH